ncbi:hypothetical protein J6590_089905 [Homalodisca vitripennis]|nr:hypothetical protein J6590_089905 [Homalodisca vitripennis]
MARLQWLSQDDQIKRRRAWLLLGRVTAERSCPCKQPACPAIGGGSEVTLKPLASRLQLFPPHRGAKYIKHPPTRGTTSLHDLRVLRPDIANQLFGCTP